MTSVFVSIKFKQLPCNEKYTRSVKLYVYVGPMFNNWTFVASPEKGGTYTHTQTHIHRWTNQHKGVKINHVICLSSQVAC